MAKGTGIEVELSRILEEFIEDKQEEIAKAVRTVARQCKQDIVAASPENTGAYKKGWTVRTKRSKHGISATVYNKDKPELTHVLEKSHVIRNAAGTWGRTSPGHGQVEHIGPAAEKAEKELVELLTK